MPIAAAERRLSGSETVVFEAEILQAFAIVNVTATPAALRARVSARVARGGDASEATLKVLEAQIENCEALTVGEMHHAVPATDGTAAAERTFCDQLAQRLQQPVPIHIQG